MQSPYRVNVLSFESSPIFLDRGFLKCTVEQVNAPFLSREFVYCLHCKQLRSIPWFYAHSRLTSFRPSSDMRRVFSEKFDLYVNDIITEVDLLNDMGKLFTSPQETIQQLPTLSEPSQMLPSLQDLEQEFLFSQDPSSFVQNEGGDLDDGFNEDESSINIERLAKCISDCFEEFCFGNKTFDIKRFASLAKMFFGEEDRTTCLNLGSSENTKAKVLSHLTRKILAMLSLTKRQMDVLNRFLKAVLVFVNPDNCSVAQKIHSGYLSCLRESICQRQTTDVFVQSCFETCKKYSIALDSAQFGQDHVLMCSVRFSFDHHLEQCPLFLSVCDASTGHDYSSFVFDRLKAMNAPLTKLVSVSTDGASCMIGQANGMFSCFKRLVQQDLGSVPCSMVHIWCLAHRLNLVIRDFQNVENINSVFLFCDWFTQKRKAVAYKRFLREKHSNKRLKKIPKPSETRWSFYRDVLESLLNQVEEVEEFLLQDEDFIPSRHSLFHFPGVTIQTPRSFFSNAFIHAHFSFAFDILKRICRFNRALQEQYTILPDVWILVCHMKDLFSGDFRQMRNGCFVDFDYIERLNVVEKETFLHVLEKLLLNMEVRFPCPSTSIDIRQARQNVDHLTNTLNRGFFQSIRNSCPLFFSVGLFLFPDEFIRQRKINQFFISGNFPEINRILIEIINNQDDIVRRFQETQINNESGGESLKTITLLDIFEFVNRENYPFLWEKTMNVLTMIPTTVSCEQYFSRLRRKLHENMSKETSFAFLAMSQRRNSFIFDRNNTIQSNI